VKPVRAGVGASGIDAVVFDLGNVLIGWDPMRAFPGVAKEEVDEFFAETNFLAENHTQDAGRPWSELRVIIDGSHPEHTHLLDMYVANFAKTLVGPISGSLELVRDLAETGIKLFGLTNWSAELFHHAEPAAPALGLLGGIVVSGAEGLAKPDPAIFHLTAERFGLEPQRTVFVDDSLANVAAASACGYQAIHFTSTPQLRRDLVALGVLTGLDRWCAAPGSGFLAQ
jgi:2-haloacid dehalogenase